MRKLKLWLFAGLLGLMAPQPAYPITTSSVAITNTAWTDLGAAAGFGAGPMQISPNVAITYAISDTTPALPLLTGFKIQAFDIVTVNTTSHVFVMASAAATGNVLVAPVSAAGGGGGGAGTSVGLGGADNGAATVTYSGTPMAGWAAPTACGAPPSGYGSWWLAQCSLYGMFSPLAVTSDGTIGHTSADPCTSAGPGSTNPKTNVSVSTATGSTQLVAGVAGKRVYVCSEYIVGQAAWVGNLVEGTGTTCGTGTAAVQGSITAANGFSFPAQGGFTFGAGSGSITQTAVTGDALCLLQSGTVQVAGNIMVVQQ